MFGSSVLDVVIGMIFVYLLLSLLCSAVNEYIEAKLNYRAKNLEKGIQLLLNGKITPRETRFLAHPIQFLKERFSPTKTKPAAAPPAPQPTDEKSKSETRPADAGAAAPVAGGNAGTERSAGEGSTGIETDLASQLYAHGLIRALYQDEKRLPSYIPSRTFALALWNLAGKKLKGDDPKKIINSGDPTKPPTLRQIEQVISRAGLDTHLQQALITLIDEADGHFDRALKNIEDWYDSAMDRVSGWYKRHVQWILLAIGFLVAILINADTVNIAKALTQDKTLRDVIVASATEYAKENGVAASPAGAKKGGADAGADKDANSNKADTSGSDAHASTNSNAAGANANANHAHASKGGGGNANNTNNSNSNTAGAGGATTGGGDAGKSNSNAAGKTGGAPNPAPSPSPNPIQQAYEKINTLGLPIGWVGKKWDDAGHLTNASDPRRVPQGSEWLLKLFGLFLTGLAISQGAPFWFDLLNKFMVIRSTVKPKEKSPDEASKDKTKPRQ